MKMRRFMLVASLLVALVVVPTLLFAQSTDVPKYTLFGGYSYYHPGGNVDTYNQEPFIAHPMAPGGNGNVPVTDLKKGWAGQFTYNLNRWAGITAACWAVNILLLQSGTFLSVIWAWMPTFGVLTWPLMTTYTAWMLKNSRAIVPAGE